MVGLSTYNLVFATGNQGKYKMLETELKNAGMDSINLVMQDMNLIEIQDDSVVNISRYKAEQAWNTLHQPVLVHDSGLNIPAFGGFPGPYTKYISKALGAQGFVDLLKDKDDKRMIFCNCLTFVDEVGEVHQFNDDTGNNIIVADYVADKSRSDQWSELWKIIIPKGLGFDKTLAEMDDNEFNHYMDLRTQAGTDNAYHDFIDFLKNKFNLSMSIKTKTGTK